MISLAPQPPTPKKKILDPLEAKDLKGDMPPSAVAPPKKEDSAAGDK